MNQDLLNSLIGTGLVTLITMQIMIWRWCKSLYDIHLGTSAIDPITRTPRWWNNPEEIPNLVKALKDNTTKTEELLIEMRIEREVERRAAEEHTS